MKIKYKVTKRPQNIRIGLLVKIAAVEHFHKKDWQQVLNHLQNQYWV